MCIPTVTVIMSTYNGKSYISDQINSILRQEDVKIRIYIRDDGSSDGTVDLLKTISNKHDNIEVEYGKNVGFKMSFFLALKNCSESEYYAFSDQDDIWDRNKLISTIKCIKGEKRSLGFCNSWNTDKNLTTIEKQYREDKNIPYYGMTFISSIASGFLMVFDNEIRSLATRPDNILIPHDLWVGSVASFFGIVKYCPECLAYHRRLSNSVSSSTPIRQFKNRIHTAFYGNDVNINEECAKIFLHYYSHELNDDQRKLLHNYECYRNKLSSKVQLLMNKNLFYDNRFGHIAIKLKILLNRF